jgi:alpha-tubulin suppressor-like RCC1 family protein
MSATYNANVTVTGNLTVATTISGDIQTSSGFSLIQSVAVSGPYAQPATGIFVGTMGTCSAFIMPDGTVRVCGYNLYGELGTNDTNGRQVLVPVPGISSQAIAVACGVFHTAILLNNGTVQITGRNIEGQLGLNDLVTRSTVVPVLGISSQAIAVACGQYFTAILLNNGTVRTCGYNNPGSLGLNDGYMRSTFVPVLGISSQAIAIACGAQHTAILLNNGTVRVCGRNTEGQLGLNDLVNRSTVVPVLGISSQAIAIACGQYFTAILLNNGTVRVCGVNQYGQLGLNDLVTRSTVVPVLGISSQAIAVACGLFHTAILLNNGTVQVCGINNFGPLGLNDTVNRSTVVAVLGISSQAIAVACGQYHTAILLNNGTVQVCGGNQSGELDQNDVVTRLTVAPALYISPVASQYLNPNPLNAGLMTSGTVASYHTALVMNDGTVRVCGRNNNGQLGQNDLTNRVTVTPVLGINSQAIAVACGQYHTVILMNDGTVRGCGQNNNGQLGLNDQTARSTVVSFIGISSQAIAVACGRTHTAILLNDGTVRMCGNNNHGELGQNNGTLVFSTLVPIVGISSQAIAVACGYYHTAILLNNGTVRVCGYNNNGQLGVNDTVNRSLVFPVLGISSQAIAVACGFFHTAILLNNGTVRVCGINSNGQLGLNDLVTRSTVVPVLGISSQAIAIACGAYHTAILLNNGTVRVCGRNANGQLGLNDLVTRSTVVAVLGISSQAIGVACGSFHTAILLNNGTVQVCGRNDFGQLATNDVVTRSTVVPALYRPIYFTPVCTVSGSGATPVGLMTSSVLAYHTALVMNDGTVRMCGLNNNGQLGQGDKLNRLTVVPVLGISSQAIAVSCGLAHTVILLNTGTVQVCGTNQFGQLGQNDVVYRSTVVSVLGISSQAIAVACGQYHTAILLNNGTVRTCGLNNNGQLGQNDTVNRSTSVPVLGISSQAIAIACGRYFTAILLNNGTVKVCGQNNVGQLGQNDLANRLTVVPVLGISSQAIAVSCGLAHTVILLNTGTVQVCGYNLQGQLGQNDTVNRSTSVPVLGISSQAIAFACGDYHSAILLNNGTVRVCGINSNGQLGLNDVVTRSTVVPVLGISSQAIAVACGQYHTAILLNNGTVRVCGVNQFGQLGLNDTVNRSSVVSVLNLPFALPYLNLGSLLLGVDGVNGPYPYQLDMASDLARKLTTSTWTTGSDQRIKTNIQTANLARCSEIIDALDLKYFSWTPNIDTEDRHSLGWIAQDVETIFPNSVSTGPAHGLPDFKTLNSDQIIKAMYGSLKNMIQKTYPPMEVGGASNTQASSLSMSDPSLTPNQ